MMHTDVYIYEFILFYLKEIERVNTCKPTPVFVKQWSWVDALMISSRLLPTADPTIPLFVVYNVNNISIISYAVLDTLITCYWLW